MVQKYSQAAIGLGGNLSSKAGRPAETLIAALAAMQGAGLDLLRVSRFYRTPAFPPGSGPDFVNACCLVGTGLPPDALLSRLHGIEAALGRERIVRWGARTVDLDLLAVGDLVLPDRATQDHWRDLPPDRQTREAPDTLILPHPRLQDRGFVLIPLADILPSWRHPVTGLTVSAMRDALSPGEKAGIWPL